MPAVNGAAIELTSAFAAAPPIWEFPVANFLVCARADVHGLFILSPSARIAWETIRTAQSLEVAAKLFAEVCGIPRAQAFGDLCRVWEEWTGGLLAPSSPADSAGSDPAADNLGRPAFAADYQLFGRAIHIRLHDADLAWDLTPRIEPFRVPSCEAQTVIEVAQRNGGFDVLVDGSFVAREDTIYSARVSVMQEVLKASGSQDWVAVLHAGACGSDTQCVLFPAASHSGKTTLAAALIHRGMTYYGDDSVPLERDTFQVQPMPFALMAREGSWPLLARLFPELEAAPILDRWGERVRFIAPPSPARGAAAKASALVFTLYEPGAATEFQPLAMWDSLLRLTESGFWLEHDPRSIGSFLEWFESLPRYSLRYSDIHEAVEVLDGLTAA